MKKTALLIGNESTMGENRSPRVSKGGLFNAIISTLPHGRVSASLPSLNRYLLIIIALFVFAPFAKSQGEQGRIIAGIDFNPERDGFGFGNYGSDHNGENDLSAEDLILMFGADKVCIEGKTAADCVLYQTAKQWMRDRIASMTDGHCDGFSVASMRTWQKLSFKGKSKPEDWQANVKATHDLEFDGKLANYIAFYNSIQLLPEINKFRSQTFKFPPSRFVKLLIESFQTGKEYYTLGVGMLNENGKYTKGHSILPIAVEEMGGGIFRIRVYDNNFPGETKYLTIDIQNETWRYNTAANRDETAEEYIGDKRTKTMSLKKMSDRNRPKYKCPFCEKSSGKSISSEGIGKEEIYFSFPGEGDLLITDPNGKQVGYDGQKSAQVNQIPDAEISYNDGGLGLDYSPDYILPYDAKAENPYQVLLSGEDLKEETDADLQITAPGFVVGFKDIRLDPDERLSVSVSPDGESLTFKASADGETPTIYITTEDGPERPSYSFQVGGVSLKAGKTMTMTIDIEVGKVYFKDDDGDEDAYDIHFERTNANGKRDEFVRNDLNMKGNDQFEVTFNKWDEANEPCVKDDDDGDGFADETCGDGDEP